MVGYTLDFMINKLLGWANMVHNDNTTSFNNNEDNAMQQASMAEQLADAYKEIDELKMKIMWMERNYE